MSKVNYENKEWRLKVGANDNREIARNLLPELQKVVPDITEFSATLLVSKGFDTVEKIASFLNFKEDDIPSFFELKDANKAVKRIIDAIKKNQEIVILGDYDNDGVMATTIMLRGLKMFGINAGYYINSRFDEGFGIKPASVENLVKKYPNVELIITVDNGIAGADGIKLAAEKGIDVVVTDHHEPPADGVLPKCCAIVDAKQHGDKYPFKEFCGAALAFKLLKAINEKIGVKRAVDSLDDLLGFVASATVSDVVPLVHENRHYVKEGILIAASDKFMPFVQLRKAKNIKTINADTFGFYYGPIVNAIGRLTGKVDKAVEFFMEDDEQKSAELLDELIKANEERQKLQQENIKLANDLFAIDKMENNRVLVFYDNFFEGVAGIVASNILEAHNKPVIVLAQTENPEIYKGSARSIPGYNIKDALDRCSELTVTHGGHELAAGLTVRAKDLASLDKALNQLTEEEEFNYKVRDYVSIDYVMHPSEITIGLTKDIEGRLEPFGVGFERPTIAMRNVVAEHGSVSKPGSKGDTLFFKTLNEGLTCRKWKYKEKFSEMYTPGSKFNMIGFPVYDTWGNNNRAIFEIEAIKKTN